MSIYELNEVGSFGLSNLYVSEAQESGEKNIEKPAAAIAGSSNAGQRRLRAETQIQKNIANLKMAPQLAAKPKPEEVAAILKKYGDPFQAIFKAAEAGDRKSVEVLLDYGACYIAEVNVLNGVIKWNFLDGKTKWNVADCACRSGNLDLIKFLVEERKIFPASNPFITLVEKEIPFLEGIDFFLSKGHKLPEGLVFALFYKSQATSTLTSLDVKNEMHNTSDPIDIPRIETIKFLINRGARLPKIKASFEENLGSIYIWHALLHNLYGSSNSAKIEAREIIKVLLPIGLNPNVFSLYMPYNPPIQNHPFPCYYTLPLGVAIQNGDMDLIKALLDAGADPNCQVGCYIWKQPGSKKKWIPGPTTTTLQIAMGNVEIMTLLLEYGAKI